MKPRNFPARKLARQLGAKGEIIVYRDGKYTAEHEASQVALNEARTIHTKKHRGN